jgi:hypothetical protein
MRFCFPRALLMDECARFSIDGHVKKNPNPAHLRRMDCFHLINTMGENSTTATIHVGQYSGPDQAEEKSLSQHKQAQEAALRLGACQCARQMHTQDFKDSSIPDKTTDFPKFTKEEILHGTILGKGGFGTVFEVRGFRIKDGSSCTVVPKRSSSRSSCRLLRNVVPDEEVSMGEIESRKFIAKHCIHNDGDARYAVKRLSPEIAADHMSLFQGIADMATETRFLSSLEHPNIIKLRAIAQGPWFHEDYFIVLDRLYHTLQTRMEV